MPNILHYSEIDSTNLQAARLIQSDKISAETILYADVQTAGRGSRGRQWESEKSGNLLVSYIYPIQTNWNTPHLAVYPIALGIHSFLSAFTSNLNLQIKWPNDILLEEKKISGTLHQIIAYKGQSYFISGIGINIGWHPEQTNFAATHLTAHAEIASKMEDMVINLFQCINTQLKIWQTDGFEGILKKITPHLYHYNKEISVHLAHDSNHAMTGIFMGIDENGALLLKQKNAIRKITAADIFPSLT